MVMCYLACLRMTSPKSGTSGTPDDNWEEEPVEEKEVDEEAEPVDVINFELTDSTDLEEN